MDDSDFEIVSQFKWYARTWKGRTYAARSGGSRNTRKVSMHRFIMGEPEGMDVDHKNGDKLDNRRENLRVCTRSQNIQNSRKHSDNKSGYKGVCWETGNNRWKAQICKDGKKMVIGYFTDKKSAALAYNAKALELFGEFASINLYVKT